MTFRQSIPLVDLNAQYKTIEADVKAAVTNVLDRGDFILGQDVALFEAEFAAFCTVKYAIGCGSGTDALYLALRALDIGQGDEVIMPAMTFVATALAVNQCGARPVLVDVSQDTALINPELVEAAITEKTKAIIPVHLYGQCADLDELLALASKHNLYVIEDAAQAHGALDASGRRAGSIGTLGCFSFYPSKNLGAYGDGGMVITNSDALAEGLRLLRNCGSIHKYQHEVVGVNSRLDTIQAAILRIKLEHLDNWNAQRWRSANEYRDMLSTIDGVTLTNYSARCVYHLYVIRVANRDYVLQRLIEAGIGAGIHYPFAIHELNAYKFLGYEPGTFQAAESWARQCISLPIYAELPSGVPHRTADLLRIILAGGNQ